MRVRRVGAQARARILHGDTHFPDRVLSIFEPHAEAIRKGKAAKPTEFGKVVKIQEAEGQIITDYHACATRMPNEALWRPTLECHRTLFGRPPRLAVADASNHRRSDDRRSPIERPKSSGGAPARRPRPQHPRTRKPFRTGKQLTHPLPSN